MSDFTFKEFLTGILKFNDENVMHIGFNSDTEDIIITNWNAVADTAKTLQTNLNGGGGGGITPDGIATGAEPSGDIELLTTTEIIEDAFKGDVNITSVRGDLVTKINKEAFYGCTGLTSINFPALINVQNEAFRSTAITELDLPLVTTTGQAAFGTMPKLKKVFLKAVVVPANYMLDACPLLETVVMPGCSGFSVGLFRNCTSLQKVDLGGDVAGGYGGSSATCTGTAAFNVLVIRNSHLKTLSDTNIFNGSCFAVTGTGGDIYVPSALISTYESATNWSALNATYKAIEGSYYETHYVDGTEIPA